ncbi:hypothetical protein D0T12_08860 [Actinomadura spongiicola]|uniref:PepSY domain-containing protein n=1 Tax=Actinomadura spongiicola TaxID=2303421 RepID=A0A372GJ66_9ACTN|nr:PepSY domain-containing protein [Actinomadura spongiicola]RFS85169.1 hypothetical protein D0T12_08860 [Actinomadura spongiicola]
MRFDARRPVSGRGLLVAVVAAGVLAGGGAASAFAADPDGSPRTTAPTAPSTPPTTPPGTPSSNAPKTSVTVVDAAQAALKSVPGGTVTAVELDDENGRTLWEVDVTDRNGAERELVVDAATAKVQEAPKNDDHDDRDVRDDD